MIDTSFSIIDSLLSTGTYDRVRYCTKQGEPYSLGTSLFTIGADVAQYIRAHIERRSAQKVRPRTS